MIFLFANDWISSMDNLKTFFKTSSVCSPSSGGAERILLSESLNCTAGAKIKFPKMHLAFINVPCVLLTNNFDASKTRVINSFYQTVMLNLRIIENFCDFVNRSVRHTSSFENFQPFFISLLNESENNMSDTRKKEGTHQQSN